jgi:hypothetical protein
LAALVVAARTVDEMTAWARCDDRGSETKLSL